ncbi:CheR family methyltransferase [Megalodesulfovibrio gigas]|uniref:protein-glutamate O-methyltransferase n=1 Tax=Megalodesulfovibrio gigas (strain ATCC 19364 / DSM 1382 / NCIMB 9332 / VKM B-1759) TaxID=1121448 RepID=T2GFI8_MEGG1|nr:protein-glutamate O-methyltransferase CheR [Megalodesulfovibrio gigas]AGW14949.1 putative chemotaxis protein methyltransferase CheR [Megalodesulfovibrio gigas DSM 1382 = ATCC 19364]
MQSLLTDADLERIRALIYKETGIYFEPKKNYFLSSRLAQRMQVRCCSSFQQYYNELLYSHKETELSCFIEEITINETYFFRDFPQLRGFAEEVLPKYLERKRRARDATMNIWSAACATGEEPYTLSIILQEMIEDYANWDTEILATDIDRHVLRHARIGLYSERSVKETPIVYRQKYFQRTADGWQLLANAMQPVTFEQLNLVDRVSMRRKRGFDFIFCRNVLIYFDDDSRKKVLSCLYDALNPGGYVFLGHSESVGRITASFLLERVGDFLCYKKPATSATR